MRKIITSILILTSLVSFGQKRSLDALWKLYQSHNYKLVIEKGLPLLNTESNKTDLNLILGRAYADKGDYKKAIPYLDYTAKNDKRNSWRKAWALGYLGTCYFMVQQYDDSQKSLKKCIKLKATKNATNYAYGRTLLFGFDEFYHNWRTVETDHFRFHFQDMTDTEIEKYISSREKSYKGINDFFKSTLSNKINFFVWDSRDDAKNILRTNLGFAKSGFYIVHSHYQQTKGHEMTHVISNYTSDISNKTRFINEGTAVCFDHSSQDRMQLVKNWIKTHNKRIVIKDYWDNGRNYPEEILYPIAGLFVKELIGNYGREKYLEFFKNQTYGNAKFVFGDKLDNIIQEFENKINI